MSYSEARKRLAKTMQEVCARREPVMITRRNKPCVVMMSVEDFEALEETAYLLRAPNNARRLIESLVELEQGGGRERELVE